MDRKSTLSSPTSTFSSLPMTWAASAWKKILRAVISPVMSKCTIYHILFDKFLTPT